MTANNKNDNESSSEHDPSEKDRRSKVLKAVCVRHRNGWCATVRQRKVPKDEERFNEPTLCGYFVIGPWGFKCRRPTCKECRKLLRKKR